MIKDVAKAMLLAWRLMALNHNSSCVCGKTAKGVAMSHNGKTEDQYNEVLNTAEG